MVGSLGKALARAGHRVGIVTPLYLGIRERFPDLQRIEMPLHFPLGVRRFLLACARGLMARVPGRMLAFVPFSGEQVFT